ncbi:MAG: hypothetical protein WKG06_20185 [Segetibacter sp.]
MQVDNLKYSILDKLISVNDNSLLEKINELIGDIDLEETQIKVSDVQRQMLIDSEQDILNKNLISDKEINEEEEQWLKE